MAANLTHYTVRLPKHLVVELDRIADASGVNRASVIRTLLAAALTQGETE